MQVLKDEVRRSILRVAGETFLESGFAKTSMKDIAREAGVAVGNLYRYFPHKEALFDAVVTPAYDGLLKLVRENEPEPLTVLAMLEQIGHIFSGLVLEHREGLLILLYGSTGTRHEGAKEEFFRTLTEHVQAHLAGLSREKVSPALSPDVARPLAVAFLEGYFEIIRLHTGRDAIGEITRQYVEVWFTGLQRLL